MIDTVNLNKRYDEIYDEYKNDELSESDKVKHINIISTEISIKQKEITTVDENKISSGVSLVISAIAIMLTLPGAFGDTIPVDTIWNVGLFSFGLAIILIILELINIYITSKRNKNQKEKNKEIEEEIIELQLKEKALRHLLFSEDKKTF